MASKEYKYVTTRFFDHDIYTFVMTVKDLLDITYVAPRGISDERGAVQRVLNKRRIEDIKDFILKGNTFVNSFILNWTDQQELPKIKKESIAIPMQRRGAQLLDGQHRAEGLREAMAVKEEIGSSEILVSLFIGLNTPEAARIFLNINSEQKPVPKSLIYDLFGEAYDNPEHALTRATDIITFLNTNSESPYFQSVKYPGKSSSSIKYPIDLSHMVNAMKPYFESDGKFRQMNITDIELQQRIIMNFYNAIKMVYVDAKNWEKKENPFFKSAGFSGAFDFLMETLLPRCIQDKNFKAEHMRGLMNLEEGDLLTQAELKNMEGKSQKKSVTSYFTKCFHSASTGSQDEYEI